MQTTWTFQESGAVRTDRWTAEREIMNINTSTSYYINPNTRQLTSNIKNTALKDKEASDFMFDKLRPVKEISAALATPLNLADETFIDKTNNALYIAEGSHFTFEGGFVYTILEKGITSGYGTQEEWNGEVATPGDASNETLNRAAQEMASAINRLLRDATGTIDESMLGQKEHIEFHNNVCKVLEYFGLDSSKDFSINGVKYTRDEDGLFRSEKSYAAQEAFEMLRNNNRSYALADESTKNRVDYMSDYYLSSAPEEVRQAWQETLEETGINPFQTGYVSTLQQLATEQDFATGGNDQIFGDSIESSLEAIDKILERIANPKHSEKEDYVSSMVPAEQEIEFYTTLRNKLTGESETEADSREILQGKIEEMQENIEAGNVDFEATFQIGGKAYTQEEWDKLLEYVDEVEEETQEAMEVEQAMKEAAEETGYDEEQMDYISQAFLKKVENMVNVIENPSNIFGSTIESALETAKELLYELENPLTPVSARGENAEEYMEQEKAYYRALIERLESQM